VQQAEIANLKLALSSSRRIGAAMGIVMAKHKLTFDQAFDLLRLRSQHEHRKVRDIAEEILLSGDPDGGAYQP
jgi:AmiR/NasT family two-component response regulator